MEKRTAHYHLAAVKAAVALSGMVCFTQSARNGVTTMGLTAADALAAVAALERQHLYKSMTTMADHTVWQDVYHCPTAAGIAYVKVTLRQPTAARSIPATVISFKKLEGE